MNRQQTQRRAIEIKTVLRPKRKKKGECYFCHKPCHVKSECRILKKKNAKDQGSKKNYVTMITEVNMVDTEWSWWIDYRAAKHDCKDKGAFKTLETIEETIYMGNSVTVKVYGKGTIELALSFGKVPTLKDVLFIPKIHNNLVSVTLMNKFDFKLILVGKK